MDNHETKSWNMVQVNQKQPAKIVISSYESTDKEEVRMLKPITVKFEIEEENTCDFLDGYLAD